MPLKVPFFPGGGVSPADQIQFLLHDPLAVIGVVRDIFGKFWRESFIGVLGWTGTRLPSPIYHCAPLALLIALSLDLVQDEVMRPTAESILASLSMIGAIALTLVTLYIVAVKVGADYFDFQGRYSIPPALLLSIIVPNHVSKLGGGLRAIQAVGWAVLLASIWICELAVPMVLSSRYYWL